MGKQRLTKKVVEFSTYKPDKELDKESKKDVEAEATSSDPDCSGEDRKQSLEWESFITWTIMRRRPESGKDLYEELRDGDPNFLFGVYADLNRQSTLR